MPPSTLSSWNPEDRLRFWPGRHVLQGQTSVEGHVCICEPGFCVTSALCNQPLVYCLFFRGSWGCLPVAMGILCLSTVIWTFNGLSQCSRSPLERKCLEKCLLQLESPLTVWRHLQAGILNTSKACLLGSFYVFPDIFMTSSDKVFPHMWGSLEYRVSWAYQFL